MRNFEPDVDLNGYKRGGHVDGDEICKQYVFTVPGFDGKVWGWNDIRGFDCKACGRPATEHVVIKAPKMSGMKPKPARAPAPPQPAIDPMNTERLRAIAAEEAAKYDTSDMLDEMNDPLAVNARPVKKPMAAPPPPPVPSLPDPPPVPTRPADLVATSDPKLSEMLQKDADYNAAFKREVERMVQEKMLAEQLEKNATPAVPAAQLAAEGAEKPPVTVSKDKFADAAALLASVSLPQYAAQFEEEAMDPATLIEVLDQQGKPALDEALKELGIKSMGHRLKIVNAMLVL